MVGNNAADNASHAGSEVCMVLGYRDSVAVVGCRTKETTSWVYLTSSTIAASREMFPVQQSKRVFELGGEYPSSQPTV